MLTFTSRKYVSGVFNNLLNIISKKRERFCLTTHSTHFIYGYLSQDIRLRTIQIAKEEICYSNVIGYSLWLAASNILYAPSHKHDSTYHSLCSEALTETRTSSKDLSVDPLPHEMTFYHGATSRSYYFSFQPVLHNWCNKCRGMCYPVCGMMHIKEPLLLIGKNSTCGGSGFPLWVVLYHMSDAI